MTKTARAPLASTADPTSSPDWMRNYTQVEKASPDRLESLRIKAKEFCDKVTEKNDLEARLKEVNKEIESYRFQKLPEMLMNAKVPSIEVAAEGNKPGYMLTLDDYHYANIKADWPQAQRDAGFAVIRELDGGDLIKNTYTLRVGRKSDKLAQRILKGLRKVIGDNPTADITLEIHENVPFNTLSAWLRELVEQGEEPTTEQLEAINGKISKQVKVKEIKHDVKPSKRR